MINLRALLNLYERLAKNTNQKDKNGHFLTATTPPRRRFAANTGWLIAQSVFQYMLSAVIGIIAARFLGPANYGILGCGVSLMAIFQAFCTLGFNDVQITNMVETPEDEGGIIGTSLTLRLISSTLSIGGIALAAWITRPGEKLLRWLRYCKARN